MTQDRKTAGRRVLLVGRSATVMSAMLDEFRALGVEAEGDIDPDRAAARPDAGSFDLVAIGRGVGGTPRLRLREAFRAANPHVQLIDVEFRDAARRVLGALEERDPAGVDLDAYFARIGYDGPRDVSLETLRKLMTTHLAAIPFETIDAVLGRGVDISAQAVDAKLIGARRGGYCYEQNGLFKRVLAALGFEVDGLIARVRLRAQPGSRPMGRSHMTLKVTVDGEAFLVDVGFGGSTPPAPLAFDEEAPQATPHERYRLLRFGPVRLLQAEIEGSWSDLYEFSGEAQLDVDYESANWFTSTHPSSFFRNALVAARTTPGARYSLYGARLSERRPDGRVERRLLSADEIERALAERFLLRPEPAWRPVIERAAEQAQ